MSGDDAVKFEEKNYDWLITRFIKANQDAWDTYVYSEWEKAQAGELEYNPEDAPQFENENKKNGVD